MIIGTATALSQSRLTRTRLTQPALVPGDSAGVPRRRTAQWLIEVGWTDWMGPGQVECCFTSMMTRYRASCPRMSVDILGTNRDQCRSMAVQCCFTSTETVRPIRTESPGRPPRFSHSSWGLDGHWQDLGISQWVCRTDKNDCDERCIKRGIWGWTSGGRIYVPCTIHSHARGDYRRRRLRSLSLPLVFVWRHESFEH